MRHNIRKIIILSFGKLFTLADFLIPKKKGLVIFSMMNNAYADNSRALFEYIISLKNNELDVVWLTTDKQKKSSNHFVYFYSVIGFWISLRANVFVINHGLRDLPVGIYFSKKTKILSLWHGIALKKIGMLNKKLNQFEKIKIKKVAQKYTLFCASSQMDASMSVSPSFNLQSNRVIITGLPRNGRFFLSSNKLLLEFQSIKLKKILNKKCILYAPTFRDFGVTKFFPFSDFNPVELNAFLEDSDAYLLLRPHISDLSNLDFVQYLTTNFGERFVLADSSIIKDVNDILPFIDIIITDYSSIYIDLLLKDCPAVFIPYDINEYEHKRGLLYQYDTVTPGPKVKNMKEFIFALQEGLEGALVYKEERIQVKNMFHEYADGKARERVYNQLLKMANNY